MWVTEIQILEPSPATTQRAYQQEAGIGSGVGTQTQTLQCRMPGFQPPASVPCIVTFLLPNFP